MFFLLPIILFGLTCVALALLRLRGMRMAYIWLLPAFITLVCWSLFLILPVPDSANIIKIPWLYSLAESGSLVFSLNSNSWGFVFLLISLVLSYFFTLPIRLEQEKRTVLWIGWMLLSISAVLSLTAGNIITLIIAWTLFDLIGFVFTFFVLKTTAEWQSLAEYYLPKILSVSLLIVANIYLERGSSLLVPNSLQPIAFFLILFAAIFRTGLVPFRLVNRADDLTGVSFEFLKKVTLILSGFSLLSHLPANFLNPFSSTLLSIIFLFLSLVLIIISLFNHADIYEVWLDALICLAVISVFSGNPQSLLGWAAVVVTGAGVQQFYSMRTLKFNFFALLCVVAISGLPFTVGLVALNGLSSKGVFLLEILSLPIYSLLLLDLIQKIITPKEANQSVESWYLVVYFIGIFLLALSPFALIVKRVLVADDGFENWWMGLFVAIIMLAAFLLDLRQKNLKTKIEKYSNKLFPILDFFRFHWLNEIWKWVSVIVTEVFSFITQLLEGEGGVIWAIVIMALLVSIIGAGR
jgi:hypothetical protein